MRRILLSAMMVMALGVTCRTASTEEVKGQKKEQAPFVHVVVFRMKEDAPKDEVNKAIADCKELLAKVPTVRSLRAGRPAERSTPGVPKMQYDFALLVLFDDADGLEEYIKHPLHVKFLEKHGAHFDREKLQIFDFLDPSK